MMASRIFCRAGDYFWDAVLVVPNLCWLEVTGQGADVSNLWGMLMLRPFSKGAFGGVFMCFLTKMSDEPTLVVQGGPWRFDQCDIRSSSDKASVAMVTLERGDALLSECAIGGLDPVVTQEKPRADLAGESITLFGEVSTSYQPQINLYRPQINLKCTSINLKSTCIDLKSTSYQPLSTSINLCQPHINLYQPHIDLKSTSINLNRPIST